MKRLFFVSFIFIYCVNVYTQIGNYLVDTTTIWSDVQLDIKLPVNYYRFYKIYDKISIDTISYLKIYYKQKLSWWDSSYFGYNPNINYWTFTGFYIRETSGKIYIKNSSSSQEYLLYDFNLNVHDSILLNSYYQFVDSVDTVIITNGLLKKRLQFNTGDIWIESIGDLKGLLINTGWFYIDWAFFMTPQLECVMRKEDILYALNGCDCRTLLKVDETKLVGLQIYPTIINNSINIVSNSNNTRYKFNLYNLNGVLLKNGTFWGSQLIDCSMLKEGIYLIQLTGEKINFSQKLIKLKM